MSSIKYTAELDSKKLEDSIKQSNKTIKDWSKDVEKSSGQVDKAFDKTAKNFKESITEQKKLIKSIEAEIKNLQKAYEDEGRAQLRSNIAVDLRSARTSLALQNKKLLDLQEAQTEANKKEEGSIGNLLGGLKKWVIGLASVGAALKIAKSIIESTTETTTKFHQITAGATAGVQYFFKAIASGDWGNFFAGLERAIKGAAEFVARMEELENLQNEIRVRGSRYDIDIAKYREDTFNREESNNDKRLFALTEVIRLTKLKYSEEAEYQGKLYAAQLKNAADLSGLEEKRIEQFIIEYSSLEEMLKLGKKYNELTRLIRKPGMDAEFVSSLLKEREALGENAKQAGEYAQQINKVTMEVRKELSTSLAAKQEAESKAVIGSRRDEMQKAALEKEIAEAKIEAAKIENKIKKEQELLNKAIEEDNQIEIRAIGERIRKLQEELVLRERIAEFAIAATMTREIPVPKIKLKQPGILQGDFKAPNILARAPITDLSDYIPGTAMLSKAGWAKQKKESAEYDKKAEDSLKKQLELKKQIANAAADLVYQIGQQVGLEGEGLAQLNGVLNTFTQLVSGDIPGAIMSLLSTVIMAFPSAAENYANEIERLNELLEEQTKIIEQSERKGGGDKARQEYIKSLKDQQALLEAGIKKTEKSQFWFGIGKKANKEFEEQLKEVMDLIEEAQQDYDDFVTGDITENTIADVIKQGFQEGKTSVDDFADYMNQVLIDAVMSVFTDTLLSSPKMKDYMEWLKGAMTGGITKAEKEENARRIAEIAAENKAAYEAMTSGLSIGGDLVNTGLSGQIQRAITEETGTELAGLFRRFADDERAVKDYTLSGLNHLVGIEANTYNTVVELKNAVTELQAINNNTKQVPAGIL